MDLLADKLLFEALKYSVSCQLERHSHVASYEGVLYAAFHKTPFNTHCNESCPYPKLDARTNAIMANSALLEIACPCQRCLCLCHIA